MSEILEVTDTGWKRFAQLEETTRLPRLVSYFQTLLKEGSDFDLYKINALRVASQLELPKLGVIREFLWATRLGIFDLNYDIYCPSCWGLPQFEENLSLLKGEAHCNLCQIDWELDLQEQVEVSFTINPAVRPIHYPHFHERDFNGQMQFLVDMLGREDRSFVLGDCFFPEKLNRFEAQFEPGKYKVWLPEHLDCARELIVDELVSPHVQNVHVHINASGEISPEKFEISAGKAEFLVEGSEYPSMNGFLIARDEPWQNFLSAAYLTNLQEFRDLFGGEFLDHRSHFSLKSISLLFTDLEGSTDMYERIGDSKAYELVQSHFQILHEIVQKNEGGVVKTIGDAVMACFPSSVLAVNCALNILDKFGETGKDVHALRLKIGVHEGPAIYVSNHENNDYFGRTVNLAARVQGQAGGQELVLSQRVYEDPQVRRLIHDRKVQKQSSKLKGIEHSIALFHIKAN